MTNNHPLHLIWVAGLSSIIVTSTFAQDSSYYYGGLSIGPSQAKIDEARISASLLAGGAASTSMVRDERDMAYKLFGGYQINKFFAVEAGYFNLGKFGFTSTTVPLGTLEGQIKLQGVNLDLVGTLPLTERWSALGRIGAQYANTRDTFRGTGAVTVANPNPKKNDAGYKVGLGAQYAFSPSVLMRGEVERYRINDAVGNRGDVNVFSLSLVFPFGRTSAPAPRAVQAPAYPAPIYVAPAPTPAPAPVVAAAPPPAPVVAPTPPSPPAPIAAPPVRLRVSFSADAFFNFDQSIVRPDGMAALDTFARDLRGTQFEMITVEGHTDRLGSTRYNQELSLRRAEAVKAYLVSSGGINPQKIAATGVGEGTSITTAQDCTGNVSRAKLIVCLQPDRRVDIEVIGTR